MPKMLGLRRKSTPSDGLLSAITGTFGEADARDVLLRLVESPDMLAEVADGVEAHTARGGRCGDALEWLRAAAGTPQERAVTALLFARGAEGGGDSTAAESLIREALEGDPEMEPALGDAAEYAAARGDVAAADAFLRRLQDPDTGLREPLRALLGSATVSGRNQPCPCGSGRKFKKCCMRTAVHPLPERAPLLYALLGTYAQRAPGMALVQSLAERTDSSVPATYFCLDMAIFEGGLAERFLRVRGDWLRPDERELITGWLATPIRLYEVLEVRRGMGVTVRALPEGERTYLQDRMFSLSVGRLDLVCGRLLSDGAGPRILGNPLWVPREHRRELLDLLDGRPGMEELAEFFGPEPDARLHNREGHDVYDCQVYQVPDTEAAWRNLLALPPLFETDEDTLDWHEKLDDGRILYKGSIERSWRQLRVLANSRERMVELERMVRDAVHNARELSRTARRMGAEPATDGGRQGRVLEVDTIFLPENGDTTEEQAATMMAQRWERGWLDAPRIAA